MARKTKIVPIEGTDNRDGGKRFLITEMSAVAAERWAIRAFLALAKGGIDIPDDIASRGLEGVAAMGWQALSGIPFHEAEPLLDEMMGCVKIIEKLAPDGRTPTDDDFEEILTRLILRKEVFALHVDFSKLAARSKASTTSAAPAGDPS